MERNETRLWLLPNGAIYREWTEQEMLEIPFGGHIKEKILWLVCVCCGTKIKPHIHPFVRPIDMEVCVDCKFDVNNKVNYKGGEYIETELKGLRCFEKLVHGYWTGWIEHEKIKEN